MFWIAAGVHQSIGTAPFRELASLLAITDGIGRLPRRQQCTRDQLSRPKPQ